MCPIIADGLQKPAVTLYERKRWLEQLENGKGITKISAESGRDIRVVKRHIEIAQEERGKAHAKHDFLLGRLEQHQTDLLDEVRRLQQVIGERTPTSLNPDDPIAQKIHEALKEHTKRLPLKLLLEKYEDTVVEYKQAWGNLNSKFNDKEAELKSVLSNKMDWCPWSATVLEDLESYALIDKPPAREYNIEKREGGLYQVSWGSSSLTVSSVPESETRTIIDCHKQLLSFANSFKSSIQKHLQKVSEIGALIMEELDVYLIKRMVPGRCRYCPF